MKKIIVIAIIGAVVLAVAAFAGVVYVNAQTPSPNTPGGYWGMGWMMGGNGGTPMYEYMHTALAEKLGIPETELESRLSNGETMWQIAQSKGLTTEQFNQWMIDARNSALDKMVAAKQITQAQADQMKQRMTGLNAGGCPMLGGRGAGPAGRSGGWGMMGRGNQ